VNTVNPIVSVVIPTYNRAHKIEAAVKSVQAQSYANWEIVIADDGSTDNTEEIVKRLMATDSRIRYVKHTPNRGAQAARNAGIKTSKGDWIAFLDSDDQWLPDSLEIRLNIAQLQNVAVVHSRGYILKDKGIKEIYEIPAWSGSIYKKVLSKEGPIFPTLLVKKEALKKINYLDEKVVAYQEWDTAIRLAKYYDFGFEIQPTFIYDYTCPDSISRNFIRAGKGYEYIVEKHFKDILFKLGPRALAYHYSVAAKWYLDGGDQANTKRCQFKSLFWKILSPSIFLQKLGQKIFKNELFLIYDGNCAICCKTITVLQTLDVFKRITYINMFNAQAMNRIEFVGLDIDMLLKNMHAIVDRQQFKGFDAYRVLAFRIPFFWILLPFLYLWPFTWVGRRIYRHVADTRTCEIKNIKSN
jgi:glycosyltransferase involved in cell wall biosynthesis